MSEHMFGVRTGKISKAAIRRMEKVAKRHGCHVGVITGNSGHCACGHGCRQHQCKIKKVWFAGPNRGEPFDSSLTRAVLADLAREEAE